MSSAHHEVSRPSYFIRHIEQDFPDIWRRIEKHAKHDVARPWMVHVDPEADISKVLPPGGPHHSGAKSFAEILPAMTADQREQVQWGLRTTGHTIQHRLLKYQPEWLEMLYAWRAFKLAYSFDEDFWGEILDTPLEGAPATNIFDHLPADTFYVSNASTMLGTDEEHLRQSEGYAQGFFVRKHAGKLTLAEGPLQIFTFDLGRWSFEEEVRSYATNMEEVRDRLMINSAKREGMPEKALQELAQQLMNERPARIDGTYQEYLGRWGGRLSALLYLCAKEPDIDTLQAPRPKVSRVGRRIHVSESKQEQVARVGYRIGSVFRLAKEETEREQADDTTGTGKRVAPHVRRAHWHTYWVGPRSNPEPSLRWISPVLVNANKPEDLVDVIHPVEGAPRPADRPRP